MRHIARIALSAALLAGTAAAQDAPRTQAVPARAPRETAAQRDARMAWWRGARFGMFIHWGLYAVPAGTYHGERATGLGEWIMNNASIPPRCGSACATTSGRGDV